MPSHQQLSLDLLSDLDNTKDITVCGKGLTVAHVYAVANNKEIEVSISHDARTEMQQNVNFLQKKLQEGAVIYGVNTGYGGSADVRSSDIAELQRSLVRHLNAGFGDTLPSCVVRSMMLVRCNSLSIGRSGLRPEVVEVIKDMLNHDLVPVVPKRGSVSASGDLMPISYLAACMMGRPDGKVLLKGKPMTAPEALKITRIKPITFQEKEALAVINAGSCASSLAACVLFEANVAAMLTQVATAMSVEALCGRAESFHPTIHSLMPHPGQQEVAANIRQMLHGSKLLANPDEHKSGMDKPGTLKQDRYALRSSPQWLGPVLETLQESVRRIHIEINSANDNPLIDHHQEEILHGANFQAISVTVAMDQARQALQLCGKLLHGQIQEMTNVTMSQGLPPNLAGSNVNTDFGFKGMDTAMASYMSELDYLTNPMTNHVLSTELHNQSVNSMGLVSARHCEQALEILQMMLANIILAQVQAIDLRWLQTKVEAAIVKHLQVTPNPKLWPWYMFAFQPCETCMSFFAENACDNGVGAELKREHLEREMDTLLTTVKEGQHVEQVGEMLGQGTRVMYRFIRKDLAVPFNNGQQYPDTSLEKIFRSIKSRDLSKVIRTIFSLKA